MKKNIPKLLPNDWKLYFNNFFIIYDNSFDNNISIYTINFCSVKQEIVLLMPFCWNKIINSNSKLIYNICAIEDEIWSVISFLLEYMVRICALRHKDSEMQFYSGHLEYAKCALKIESDSSLLENLVSVRWTCRLWLFRI